MKVETVTLEKYSYGGEAFGRLKDGRAAFVPFALPGERVRIRLVEEKKGYVRGQLLEVLESSPHRIKARCQHYSRCGGCHYQHLPYQVQLQAKTEILRDQLIRIGHLENPPLQPIVTCPAPWHYRNHVQFHLTPQGKLGYLDSTSLEIIPIQECYLPEEPIGEIWPRLDVDSIPGLSRLSLRVGAQEDVLLNLESSDPKPLTVMVDLPVSVVHSGPGGTLILAGDDYIQIEIAGRIFKVSAGSFFQVNTKMTEKMVHHILDHLPILKNATLVDAYCGVGLFSAFLAARVNHLIGIEVSPSACQDFVENLDEFDNVDLYEAAVGDVLRTLQPSPDILIIDPPRAGVDRQAMDGLLSLSPEVIVYISCDPATLARDIRRLSTRGYQLVQITPFDLFPQTYHIESISFLKKTA